LINSLKRSKAVSVGARPGVTRSVTEIFLGKNITLIDCPGIIFTSDMSASDAALRNCINFDQIEDVTLPIQAILNRCTREQIVQIYKIPMFSNPTEFLQHIAIKRGKVLRGGIHDIEGAARIVLQDWNSGKIPYYTIPPESDFAQNRLEATIVSEWSEAFKLSDIVELEQKNTLNRLNQDDSFLTIANTITSEPLKPHDAFMKLNREDDDPLEDIQEEHQEPKTHKKRKSKGVTALAPIKEKKEAPSNKQKKKDKKTEQDTIPKPAQEQDNYDFGEYFWAGANTEQTTTEKQDNEEELKDNSCIKLNRKMMSDTSRGLPLA